VDIRYWIDRGQLEYTEGWGMTMRVLEGRKDDAEKDPWDLVPWDAVRAVVKVLAFGARKYTPHNWAKGMAYSRLYAATMRHMVAWWEGEKTDPETGFSHLSHACCCVLFLLAYETRGVGSDDRPAAMEFSPDATRALK
jgi:hypothetical protein